MMDTAVELYAAILRFSSSNETSICQLHKPCNGHPLCSTISVTPVIDFDQIEKTLATGNRSSLPSCDGVALNASQTVFCFVEIKGWDKYVCYNIVNTDNPTAAEKAKVDKQVSTYDLKGKLLQSIKDCEIIAGRQDLFPRIPYAYIVVTDINSNQNGIEDFASNLSSLAETASVWTYCDERLKESLSSIDIVIKKVYAHCRDFDAIMSQISV